MSKKPVVLMVLDGYGLSDHKEGNAIAMANTPVMDKLMAECPFVKGAASGLAVGLPDGQMGNSEVGHMNIGAGRIIYQDLTRITKAIADGDFFKNKVLISAIENCKKNDSDLHLWGLLSDGGVHSHIEHLYGLLELCKKENFDRVYVHAFLDGRDTPPASGKDYIEQLLAKMKEIGVGKIASLSGRYYAMDRDNNYDRVKLAYDALESGKVKILISDGQNQGTMKGFGDTRDNIPAIIELSQSGVLSLSDAVATMTCNPAALIGNRTANNWWTDKIGHLGVGALANVTVVDMDDKLATYTIVNGEIVSFENRAVRRNCGAGGWISKFGMVRKTGVGELVMFSYQK